MIQYFFSLFYFTQPPWITRFRIQLSLSLSCFLQFPSLLYHCVAGRYAEVYRGGTINGVDIAIKCFAAQHRKMWHDEKEIYKLPGMGNHENITRFFGAMQNGNNGNAGTMWIVIQYYPKGSIYDYLKGLWYLKTSRFFYESEKKTLLSE